MDSSNYHCNVNKLKIQLTCKIIVVNIRLKKNKYDKDTIFFY